MKKIFVLAASLFFTLAAMAQLPDVQVENQLGEQISTLSLLEDGKPMIVSFWSTTCKPCILELNSINDLLEEWRAEADFNVVAVSTDDVRSSAKAKSMASGNGWSDFVMIYDKNQEFKRAMNVNLVPQAFVLDADGKIIYSHTGYTPGSEMELFEKIKSIK